LGPESEDLTPSVVGASLDGYRCKVLFRLMGSKFIVGDADWLKTALRGDVEQASANLKLDNKLKERRRGWITNYRR